MTGTGDGCVAEILEQAHPLALQGREQGPDPEAVILTAKPPLVLLDLRCRAVGTLNAALKTPVELASPTVARFADGPEGTLYRLGPDWWHLRCVERSTGDRILATAKPGVVGVTDISDAYVALALTGPRARDVLAKAATIDLHPEVFVAGCVARTLFGRVTVILSRPEGAGDEEFDLVISRSNARFLWRWLADASQEYGYTLVPAA